MILLAGFPASRVKHPSADAGSGDAQSRTASHQERSLLYGDTEDVPYACTQGKPEPQPKEVGR
jgi:hypothetical protein